MKALPGRGSAIFTWKLGEQEFKNFDGVGQGRRSAQAYVESVPVEITGRQVTDHLHRANGKSPINGIEIIPQP